MSLHWSASCARPPTPGPPGSSSRSTLSFKMRDLFEIQSSSGLHPVRITDASVRDAVAACEGSLILADSFFRDHLEGLDRPIIFIEATEEAKKFQAVCPLIGESAKQGPTPRGRMWGARAVL